MGFITAAIIGGALLGGLAINEQKKARKSTEANMAKQEGRARNLARAPTVLDDTGAEIELGTDGVGDDTATGTTKKVAKARKSVAGQGSGGLGAALGPSAGMSVLGGLGRK